MLRIQGVLVRRLKAYFIKRLSNTAAMGHALTGKAQQTHVRLEKDSMDLQPNKQFRLNKTLNICRQ